MSAQREMLRLILECVALAILLWIVSGALYPTFYGMAWIALIFPAVWFMQRSGSLKAIHGENLFGVHQEEDVTIDFAGREAFEYCLSSITALGIASSIRPDIETGRIRIRTKITLKSQGELVLLTISKVDDNKSKITISSKPALARTIFDHGKNSENVRAIVHSLNDVHKIGVNRL